MSTLKHFTVRALDSPGFSRLFSAARDDVVSIFVLHRFADPDNRVSGHSPDLLRQALQYLRKRKYNLISLRDLLHFTRSRHAVPKRAVIFTLDDGFYEQAEIAAPIFEEFACPATIFLVTGFVDRVVWPTDWQLKYIFQATKHRGIQEIMHNLEQFSGYNETLNDKEWYYKCLNYVKSISKDKNGKFLSIIADALEVDLPQFPPEFMRPISWDTARKLEARGITFGSQAVSHSLLSRLGDNEAKAEIFGSWSRLQDELAMPLPAFSYPTGREDDFGPRDIRILRRAGYKLAFTTAPTYCFIHRIFDEDNYRYNIGRFSFPDDLSDIIQYSSWIELKKSQIRHLVS